MEDSYPDWLDERNLQALIGVPGTVLGSVALGWFLMGSAITGCRDDGPRCSGLLAVRSPRERLRRVAPVSPAFIPRYLLVAAPALMILAAWGLTASRVSMVVGSIVVVALVWLPTSNLRSQPSQYQDYR